MIDNPITPFESPLQCPKCPELKCETEGDKGLSTQRDWC